MEMKARALVSQTRFPEIDRDRGSQRVDLFIQWLLEEGWSVSFVASEGVGDPRHQHRLRQQGVATFTGYDDVEELIAAGDFELAVLAFWQPASKLLPVLRKVSPNTRVIVDSIDLHFLRDARRVFGAGTPLGERFGSQFVGELNTYRSADVVLTVSIKEADLLADFLGPDRAYELPLAEPLSRSQARFEQRSGILFVGNFRHLPNGEAVEYLCRDILPRLDSELLAAHPLSVVGSSLDDKVRAHGRGLPAVKMIGWVPSVLPYLESARVCAVPLLHGAGVKGKVVESLMTGTPVVTTAIGAEGIGLRHSEHAVIAETPGDLAAGLAHMLTDAQEWQRLANAGHELVSARHDPMRVRERFLAIVREVLSAPARAEHSSEGFRHVRRRELEYRETVMATGETLRRVTELGSTVLVVSQGDDGLADVEGRHGCHFPQAPDGGWAGYHPPDSDAAVRHLEELRQRGARYLAIPSPSFWWLHHYGKLDTHLRDHYSRIYSGEHLVVFDLAGDSRRAGRRAAEHGETERVLVLGTFQRQRACPPPSLVAEFGRSDLAVTQRWRPRASGDDPFDASEIITEEEADWVVYVDDAVDVPAGFLDDFLNAASRLTALGVERAQPSHAAGPDMGVPVTERLRGVFSREVRALTALPVLAVRKGAGMEGPVALIDAVPVGLHRRVPQEAAPDPTTYSDVLDVFMAGGDRPERAVQRSHGSPSPLISVLIATHDRPDLLAGCLEGLCEQTLPTSEFEVVVVDDGSPGEATATVLEGFAARLPLTWVRISHAGRSAAKNLAVLLARGDVVLFFDDDDLAAPDLLAEHLRGHEQHSDESTAILGHTGWDPRLRISALMHYLTDVDKMLFSYGNLEEGQTLDWRGFWEGRISSKRSLHLRHGLHDQRLEYSVDVEMGWRLARHGLEVIYRPSACSFAARPIDFDAFCRRHEAKGRAQAAIAALHDDPVILAYTQVEGAIERWEAARHNLDSVVGRALELEMTLDDEVEASGKVVESRLAELHHCYRTAFQAYNAKGIAETLNGRPTLDRSPPPRRNGQPGGPEQDYERSEVPALTVTMPIWSRTPELAEMAAGTIERVWEVARLPTEVVVIDNGSPEQRPMRARVHRFDENRGVSTAWNAGIELAQAPVVAVLNSDCRVEPGWDEALYEAVTTGRRIAFPYTDHCDGEGYRQPDQGGTAGWCFMLPLALYREIGPFDERFAPAYGEDTDYWHRAWDLEIELSPVPDGRVTHPRRTSVQKSDRAEWLLMAHRYKYGWKHGVEPLRAPPYYNREIVEYHCRRSLSRASTT